MGAKIEGHGTARIRIQGVEQLHGLAPSAGAQHHPGPDRDGDLSLRGGGHRRRRGASAGQRRHLGVVIDKLREAGVSIEAGDGWIRVKSDKRPRAVSFKTSEYPAFPTTCRRSSWRSTALPTGRRKSPRRSSKTASCT